MKTDVVIVGGGPSGAVLALQLAKLGVRVVLLESTTSYQRSFRGESMQPDTVGIFHELGIAPRLTEHGYAETHRMEVSDRGRLLLSIDYSTKPYRHKYIMDVPQPVLLDAIFEKLAAYPHCTVLRGATMTGLIDGDGRVRGVRYRRAGESAELHCHWVIGADGRYSRVRKMSGLTCHKRAMQRDFLWFKVPVPPAWPADTARIMLSGANHLVLLPTFCNLYRAGVNIPKGHLAVVKRGGIGAFHDLIERIYPQFAGHVREHVREWSGVHMLEIFTLVMPRWWREGLLLIGDAAHTVTPMLGQGVNLAIQDAMSLAPLLAEALRKSSIDRDVLGRFQALRQPDIDYVLRMQMRQERLLCAESRVLQWVRRVNYRMINRSARIQSRLMDRLAYQRQRQLLMP